MNHPWTTNDKTTNKKLHPREQLRLDRQLGREAERLKWMQKGWIQIQQNLENLKEEKEMISGKDALIMADLIVELDNDGTIKTKDLVSAMIKHYRSKNHLFEPSPFRKACGRTKYRRKGAHGQ